MAELTSLARRIAPAAGADAGMKASLLQLATNASANIKADKLEDAARLLAELRAALDAPAATPAATPAQPAPEPQAQNPQAALAALIRRIPEAAGAGPQVRAQLMQLATDANASLKSGDTAQAANLVTQLGDALQAALAAPPQGGTEAKPSPASGDDLLTTFRDAKDEVDDGLNRLRAALLDAGDDDLARIAEYGLYGMTDGGGVGLMKALLDLRSTRPDTRDPFLKAARDAAAAYKAALIEDPAVDLVDSNPFGIEVGIRAKLGAALDTIAAAA
jgi:hypothetical protein